MTEDAVTKRSDKFFRHVLGTDKTDLVYEEKDEMFDIGTFKSLDKKVIFRDLSKTSAEVHYLLAAEPTAALKIILPRQPEHEYDVNHRNGLFYIRTGREELSRRHGVE